MSDFIVAAQNELTAVQQELAALPLFQKYERLRDLVALYGGGAHTANLGARAESRFDAVRERKKINRPPSKHREEALALAAQVIKGRYVPTRTADIYEMIVPLGAQIGGSVPQSNLSAMLHHSDVFRSHGRLGWTLGEYDDLLELLGSGPADGDKVVESADQPPDTGGRALSAPEHFDNVVEEEDFYQPF